MHQYCLCTGPLSECKLDCDKDSYCKGYVAWNFGKPEGQCLLATTSTCPEGCVLDGFGNVGPLIVNETCGPDKDDWGGCHIKMDQGMIILYTRLVRILFEQDEVNFY